MKSINLLPKVPLSKQYFGLIMTGIIGVALVGMSGLTILYAHTGEAIRTQTELRDDLQLRKSQLMKERMVDPQTASYKAFAKEVEGLKQNIRYWPPVFEALTAELPAASRIVSVDADKDSVIKLNVEMSSLEDLAGYMILLQDSPLLDKVSLLSLDKKAINETLEAAEENPVSSYPYNAGTSTGLPASNSSSQSTKTLTPEEYAQMLKDKSTSEEDPNEADNLLNQLDWIINQQMSKQLHGIVLPDLAPTPSESPAPQSSSPITQEDIDKARKALESVQKVQVTNAPKPAQGTTGSGSGQGAASPEDARNTKYLFAASLEIKCKPLETKEK